MNIQVDTLTSTTSNPPEIPLAKPVESESVQLLKQLVELQREQVAFLRASAAANDNCSRWRAYLRRWQGEFPRLTDNCKATLPMLERSYGNLMSELTERLRDEGAEALENEYTLQEILERYGMKLAQLGTILNLVGSLAEAGSQGQES